MVVVRVLEGNEASPEGAVRARLERVQAIVIRAEKMASAALRDKADPCGAKILKRRAHEEIRMAMRLIGILMIEFGVDMSEFVVRARQVLLAVRSSPATVAQ